ncbi:MAG: ParB/RepB/Spo0J family partition protein [Verrucomicrobiota bacterium]|nr:ParB/RepB/Spo0J family partition protein [Verrucomicrobiota bacterium]
MDALIQGGSGRPAAAKATAKPAAKAATPKKTASAPAAPAKAVLAESSAGQAVRMVLVEKIVRNPWQPRREFAAEALQELADSIKAKGLLQPVLLRRRDDDGFELIAGERRYRAAQLAGLSEIPALLQEATDVDSMELALIENIQRADLNLMEEAEGYRTLVQAGLTQDEIARRVGKARATVANMLRLLELSDSIKRALANGTLSAGHAKVLLGVEESNRELLAARVMAQGLSVRALEKLVAGLSNIRRPHQPAPKAETGKTDEKAAKHLKFLADRMQQELGTKVHLAPARQLVDGKREMGRIVIEFFDNEDLSRLLETLNLGDLA